MLACLLKTYATLHNSPYTSREFPLREHLEPPKSHPSNPIPTMHSELMLLLEEHPECDDRSIYQAASDD